MAALGWVCSVVLICGVIDLIIQLIIAWKEADDDE